ncbi:hypothetical protein EJ07DRAFT_158453 [Lizonia empirigonia]|nr:hypothetical protein EJ07DRAFT_158453 [Lizonia empirigonia]
MPVEQTLPFERSLFITTPNAIHLRSRTSSKLLFACESADGIVTARAPADNSSVLAVADSQVVILYDTTREQRTKHKLRGGDTRPRLLLFSPDSRFLFFATTLSTIVYAYSLPTGDLLHSSPPHPSPPNVVAVSHNGNILLSASPSPPTILLQDRRWGSSAPLYLQPIDSPSASTCAAFQTFDGSLHPVATYFVLGFQDGTLAMYRASLPSLSQDDRFPLADQIQSVQLQAARIGAMKKLHKAAMGGVTAAAFIPGYTSRVHVSGPATSLSVTTSGPKRSRGRKDRAVLFGGDAAGDQELVFEGIQTLIAVGTYAGKVLIFNVLGLPIHELVMDVPIKSVEWVGDMSAPSILPHRKSALSPGPGAVIESLMEPIGGVECLLPPNTTTKAE